MAMLEANVTPRPAGFFAAMGMGARVVVDAVAALVVFITAAANGLVDGNGIAGSPSPPSPAAFSSSSSCCCMILILTWPPSSTSSIVTRTSFVDTAVAAASADAAAAADAAPSSAVSTVPESPAPPVPSFASTACSSRIGAGGGGDRGGVGDDGSVGATSAKMSKMVARLVCFSTVVVVVVRRACLISSASDVSISSRANPSSMSISEGKASFVDEWRAAADGERTTTGGGAVDSSLGSPGGSGKVNAVIPPPLPALVNSVCPCSSPGVMDDNRPGVMDDNRGALMAAPSAAAPAAAAAAGVTPPLELRACMRRPRNSSAWFLRMVQSWV
mmetsp:Transcript_15119/g.36566  ORF Transcript_15119/g.36566 Transcript_15119/m.36566 type:complete len:330 (-) Transcript_15119:1651-2640(-)